MNAVYSTVDLLKHLVAIPSVNPDGNPGVTRPGEGALVRFLARLLRSTGAKVRIDEILPGRPNLLARFPLRSTQRSSVRRRVLFAPHSDTVSVVGMTIDPFDPVVKGGKLFGRGASDTKGPMAAMLTALMDVVERDEYLDGHTEFHFAAFMGEEAGCVGSRSFASLAEAKDYALAVIGEPTDFHVVHAHKGAVWAEITVPGQAGHASVSLPDSNAHFKMARVLTALEKDFLPWLARHPHPVLGCATATPTILAGGSKANIAPQDSRLTLDIRTVPNLSRRMLMTKLDELLKATGTGARFQFPEGGMALDTPPDHPLIQAILPATRGLTVAPWFCDAASLAAVGVPAVALGPGSILQAHTKDEWIRVKDLEDGHQRFVRIMEYLMESRS